MTTLNEVSIVQTKLTAKQVIEEVFVEIKRKENRKIFVF